MMITFIWTVSFSSVIASQVIQPWRDTVLDLLWLDLADDSSLFLVAHKFVKMSEDCNIIKNI